MEFLLIIVLFIYVIYLQFRLAKKDSILNSIFRKIHRPDSKLKKEDILLYLESLTAPKHSVTKGKDQFLNKNIMDFLFETQHETNLFLHYTTTKNIAQKIIHQGFKFVNSFYKTAEYIYNDELYLIQRHHEHKQFGDFVIVICISKKTYNHYTKELSKIKVKNVAVEQILTELPSELDENSEEVFTLPKQFIKGYFNYSDGTIVTNPEFNPDYSSSTFQKNLRKLTTN